MGITGLPEGEDRKKGREHLFKEVTAENFTNLRRNLDIQAPNANRPPHYFRSKRSYPRHINKTVKIKDKKNNLKSSKEKKTVAYKGTSIRLSVGFLAETLSARREG